jgi:hypothetical protein
MCPLCIAAAALMAGKTITAGGLTALTVRKLRSKPVMEKPIQISGKENQNGH